MRDETTVTIKPERKVEAVKALDKLVRKANRYGSDAGYRMGDVYYVEKRMESKVPGGRPRTVLVPQIDVTVWGDAPTFGDFEFLARVEHTAAGNVVDTRPGAEVDPRFRHEDNSCEHCRTNRQRKLVYVVLNRETGKQIQVGRTCLRDALGIDDPKSIAARFTYLREVRALDDEYGWGDSYREEEYAPAVLALTAACVRLFGWASAAMARQSDVTATSHYVNNALHPPRGDSEYAREQRHLAERCRDAVTDEDGETAVAVLAWVRDEMSADSDYTHNLKVVLAADLFDPKRLNFVCSALGAYLREHGAEARKTRDLAAQSEYVGAKGERLKDLAVTQESCRVVGYSEWGDRVLAKFRDDAGNLLVWWTSRGTGLNDGERATLAGTVKCHDDFRGEKQTVLTRCKVG